MREEWQGVVPGDIEGPQSVGGCVVTQPEL
jgi:hypothetical protein